MTCEELDAELHRLDCGHKWCGPLGFIFFPEKTGGLNIEGEELHFWGCCANCYLDGSAALDLLHELPDGVGHKRMCDALRQREGLPEYPRCLHVGGRVPGDTNARPPAIPA